MEGLDALVLRCAIFVNDDEGAVACVMLSRGDQWLDLLQGIEGPSDAVVSETCLEAGIVRSVTG